MIKEGHSETDQSFILFDDDTLSALRAKGYSIQRVKDEILDELCEMGIPSDALRVVPDPCTPEDTREVFLACCGAAVVIAAATPLIIKVMERLGYHGKTIVTDREQQTVLDANGKPTFYKNGKPVQRWVEKTPVEDLTSQGAKTSIEAKKIGLTIGVE